MHPKLDKVEVLDLDDATDDLVKIKVAMRALLTMERRSSQQYRRVVSDTNTPHLEVDRTLLFFTSFNDLHIYPSDNKNPQTTKDMLRKITDGQVLALPPNMSPSVGLQWKCPWSCLPVV